MNQYNYLKILAYTALTLGFFAVIVDGNNQTKYDRKKIAELIESENDHYTVQELADSLIHKKQNLRIIDLRNPTDFSDYHLPNAENISLQELIEMKFRKDETIILYSEGGIHAAQVWILLKEKGLDVYSLKGGLDAWKNEILFPQIAEWPRSEELKLISKIKKVSLYFGGHPKIVQTTDSSLYINRNLQNSRSKKEIPKKHAGNYGC